MEINEKSKRSPYNEKELLSNLIKKYGDALNSIEGCIRIQTELIKETSGNVTKNRSFILINERCYNLINKAEKLGIDVREYREKQNKLEEAIDKLDGLKIPKYLREKKAREEAKSKVYGQPKRIDTHGLKLAMEGER